LRQIAGDGDDIGIGGVDGGAKLVRRFRTHPTEMQVGEVSEARHDQPTRLLPECDAHRLIAP
jgi:hypothetical protein